jgi:hypothetical protein
MRLRRPAQSPKETYSRPAREKNRQAAAEQGAAWLAIEKASAKKKQVAVNLENNHEWKHRLRAQRPLELYCGRGEQVNTDQFCAQQLEHERGQARRW